MRLIKQDTPQCLVYSAAMLLDCDPSTLVAEIGTDGTGRVFDAAGNSGLRGIHIQEIQQCFLSRDFALAEVEKTYRLGNIHGESIVLTNEHHHAFLYGNEALLLTSTHACAWDGEQVYDPNGVIAPLSNYTLNSFWIKSCLTNS